MAEFTAPRFTKGCDREGSERAADRAERKPETRLAGLPNQQGSEGCAIGKRQDRFLSLLQRADVADFERIPRDRDAGDDDRHHGRPVRMEEEVIVDEDPEERQDQQGELDTIGKPDPADHPGHPSRTVFLQDGQERSLSADPIRTDGRHGGQQTTQRKQGQGVRDGIEQLHDPVDRKRRQPRNQLDQTLARSNLCLGDRKTQAWENTERQPMQHGEPYVKRETLFVNRKNFILSCSDSINNSR